MDTNQEIMLALIIITLTSIIFLTRNRLLRKNEFDLKDMYKRFDLKEKNLKKNEEKIKEDKNKLLSYEIVDKKEIKYETPDEIDAVKPIDIPRDDVPIYKYNDKKIEFIDGIGPSYKKKLNENEIYTISDLLKISNQPEEFKKLNEKTGIYSKLFEKWLIKADFLRIQGIRNEQIDQLIQIGITSTASLIEKTPESIHHELLEKYNYSEIPTVSMISRWKRISEKLKDINAT